MARKKRTRRSSSTRSSSVDTSASSAGSAAPAHIPGFVYDEGTQRYYAIDSSRGRPAARRAPERQRQRQQQQQQQQQQPEEESNRHLASSSSSCFSALMARSLNPRSDLARPLLRRYAVAALVGAPPSGAAIAPSQDGGELVLAGGASEQFGAHLCRLQPQARRTTLMGEDSRELLHFGASSSPYTSLWLTSARLVLGSTLGDRHRCGRVFVEHVDANSTASTGAREVRLRRRSVWCCAPMPCFDSSGLVLVGCSKGACQLSLCGRSLPPRYLARHESDVMAAAPSVDGKVVFTGSRDHHLRFVDARTLQQCDRPMRLASSVSHVVPLSNNVHVLAAAVDGSIVLLDRRSGAKVLQRYHGNVVHFLRLGVCVDHTNTLLFAAGSDNIVRTWDLQSGNLILEKDGFDSPCSSLAWLPARRSLLVGTAKGLAVLEPFSPPN